jgi:multicomponent Na+:H+ antiporter subunit D
MDARIIPLFVIIPLVGCFLVSLAGKRIRWAGDVIANVVTVLLGVMALAALAALRSHDLLVYKVGGWMPPLGIGLVLDPLSGLMLVIINSVAAMVSVYAISYMERYTAKDRFYALFLMMLSGMNGVVVTGDMFNLFVFLEIGSIASYALVAFGTEEEELEASLKYMVMGSVAAALILIGIALLYAYTSTLNMADMARVLAEKHDAKVLGFVAVLFIAGFGLKGALVPFHWWLPDAHPSAPAPISAMLSGLLIKALGVYALIRVFFSVLGSGGVAPVFMVLGTLSMLVGVFLAIGQWDFKRLLAYHSISQVGYIMLGVGLGTPLGILGGLFHLFNHSIFKSLLFLNSGAVDYAAGTRDLQQMGGLRQRMPVTASTSLIASMSIAGIPPFNGFWSKLLIVIACIQAGRPGYALAAVIASLMTLASFMKVQKYAFFGDLRAPLKEVREVPFSMRLAMVVLAAICVVSGLLLLPAVSPALLKPAVKVLLIGKDYAQVVFHALQ